MTAKTAASGERKTKPKTKGFVFEDQPWQFRLMATLRVPILMFIVVPLSFLIWFYRTCKATLRSFLPRMSLSRAKQTHASRVESVAAELKAWNDDGRKKKLRTSRANWLSMSTRLASNKVGCHLVNVGHLDKILEFDEKERTVTMEPMVTFGDLSEFLMPKGYCMQTHVEMESITIGGVTMGFGLETNSHVHGFFQESVVEYEIVTPDAEVRTVTAESDPELFYALPWSYGTIGFLTKVKCKVVPAKKFVRVEYIPTFSPEELSKKMNELAYRENPPTFLEATVYTKNNAVIQVANFVDLSWKDYFANIFNVNYINYWFKPFYYKWVETFLKKGRSSEYIPTKHFYHRFTRSIFWEIEDMIPFANNPIYRFFWGWMGAPEVSLLKLFQGPVIRKSSVYAHVVQESIMPLKLLATGIHKFHDWYEVYPLLVFPVRVYDRGDLSGFVNPKKRNLHKGKKWGIWVDVGAYGVPGKIKRKEPWCAKTNIRAMEHWTRDVGGWQALYTDIFCSEKELRQMFDHTLVDKARKRFGADNAFGEVYSKVRPEAGLIDISDVVEAERQDEKKRR